MSHGVKRIHEKGMLLTTTGVCARANEAGNFQGGNRFPTLLYTIQGVEIFKPFISDLLIFGELLRHKDKDVRDQFGFWLKV